MTAETWRSVSTGLLATLAIGVTIEVLQAGHAFFVPVTFAIYLSLLLLPIHDALTRLLPKRIRGLATFLTTLVPVLAAGLVFAVTWWAVGQATSKGPGWEASLHRIVDKVSDVAARQGVDLSRFTKGGGAGLTSLVASLGNAVLATISLVTATVIVLFLVILILSERASWPRKAEVMFRHDRARDVLRIALETAHAARVFLLWRIIAGGITAVLVGLLLLPVGIDLIPLWMLLEVVLNLIPNVGSLIAGVFPTVFAFAEKGWGAGLIVMGGIFVIEQIVGNYIDPKLQGKNLILSPSAVLVALLLFAWIWGVAGAILAGPILATIRTVSLHVPALLPLAVFLGIDPGVDPDLPPEARMDEPK